MIAAPANRHPLNARLINHLEGGGSVLTATRRQALLIRRLHDQAQHAAGRPSWRTADALPLQAWISARWQEATWHSASLPVLLTDAQAAWPWRRHAASFIDATLVDARDLAVAARRSWVSLLRHGGSLDLLERQSLTRDQRQFLAWAREVESDLQAGGWLDPGALEVALAGQAGLLAPSAPLLLAGFASRPASIEALARALSLSGWTVDFAPLAGPARTARIFRATDPDAELAALAGWLRQQLEAHPEAMLGVVVADLQARRGALERRFEAVLQPELEMPGTQALDRLFDFAGGPPLTSLRITEAALDCLECGEAGIRHETFSRLLRCRHVGQAAEGESRLRLDVALRRQSLLERPLPALARHSREGGCPVLAASIEAAARELHAVGTRAPADSWAGAFGRALGAWGWPGEGSLASDQFQAAEALRERLGDFARMSLSAPPMTLGEARSEFAALLAAPFQPERGEAPVLVYDAFEPTGVAFDGLWVAGLTASAWPRAAAQDPFLPLALQAALGMPGATADSALADALATTGAWLGTAPEVVFSWPAQQDDAIVEPSRLLPDRSLPITAPAAAQVRARQQFAAAGLEAMPCDPAPHLTETETTGGARIFDLQAKCPFRAFAELRLGSGRLEEPSAGVDARSRGLVLHRALELIWSSVKTQAALLETTGKSLDELLERSLARALAETLPADAGRRVRLLEAEWQRAALVALLELDRGRRPFDVVAVEQDRDASFAGLRLRIRPDRIDRVGEGLLIIDYKTGKAGIRQWRGARPDAPQLPLYSLLQAERVAAVAFGSIGAQGARLLGVGDGDALAAGIVAAEKFPLTEEGHAGFSWSVIRKRWAGWLASLARGYIEGNAAVDPKQPQTCRQCHLQTLCRVAPEPETGQGEGTDE